jgi:hypothetical protein
VPVAAGPPREALTRATDNVYKFPVGVKENLSNFISRNLEIARKAYGAGVRMLMGSDAVYNGVRAKCAGAHMVREARNDERTGAASATVAPAEMLGL